MIPLGNGISQAQVEATGRFTIGDVFPGNYRVSATLPGAPAASTWVVQSITAGDEDVLDMPLDVDGRRASTAWRSR